MNEKLNFIKQLSFFNSLDDEKLNIIDSISKVITYPKNSILYYENDINNKISQCAICFTEIQYGIYCSNTKCGIFICTSCLELMMRSNNYLAACPECNTVLYTE
jgi:hypothetical protein